MSNALTKISEIIGSNKTTDMKLNELKQFIDILRNRPQATVDWQLVAGYLDTQVFEFILNNREDKKIAEFGLKLAGGMADKFGLVRNLNSDNTTIQ